MEYSGGFGAGRQSLVQELRKGFSKQVIFELRAENKHFMLTERKAFRQRTLDAKAFGVPGVFKEKRKHVRIEISEGGEKGRRGGQSFGG